MQVQCTSRAVQCQALPCTACSNIPVGCRWKIPPTAHRPLQTFHYRGAQSPITTCYVLLDSCTGHLQLHGRRLACTAVGPPPSSTYSCSRQRHVCAAGIGRGEAFDDDGSRSALSQPSTPPGAAQPPATGQVGEIIAADYTDLPTASGVAAAAAPTVSSGGSEPSRPSAAPDAAQVEAGSPQGFSSQPAFQWQDERAALEAAVQQRLAEERAATAARLRALFGGAPAEEAAVAGEAEPQITYTGEDAGRRSASFRPLATSALVNAMCLLFGLHWAPLLVQLLRETATTGWEPLAAFLLLSPPTPAASWWQLDALKVGHNSGALRLHSLHLQLRCTAALLLPCVCFCTVLQRAACLAVRFVPVAMQHCLLSPLPSLTPNHAASNYTIHIGNDRCWAATCTVCGPVA